MTAGGWKSTAQGASLKFSRNSLYLHLLNTIVMPQFRNMTPAEIAAVESLGSSAEAWSQVSVADDFTPFQLLQSHLEGKVVVGSGARIIRSRVCNYHIGEGALVEGVTALECRRRSTFGNGVGVATMNECGGRTVKIYDRLSAQAAYLMAVYRHRPQTMAALEKMVDDYAEARASQTGSVGKGSRIVGARFIREVRIGDNVTVDGCSILENGTVCDGAHIGVDVKAYDFIAAENARIDNGSIVERCFVGESCRLDKAFTAAESLFFANSHCENGEAASIFAGPYTVSHHKSSLLIAGMFSFFNAGSGSNQSNHLFKSGAVHQAVHLRGCKFASGAYIMSPALEGAFTMIMGHHSFHHDTSAFPYSYLVERRGVRCSCPGRTSPATAPCATSRNGLHATAAPYGATSSTSKNTTLISPRECSGPWIRSTRSQRKTPTPRRTSTRRRSSARRPSNGASDSTTVSSWRRWARCSTGGNRRNATTAAAAGSTSPDSISPNAKSRPSSTP